jgi:hypothetical protein
MTEPGTAKPLSEADLHAGRRAGFGRNLHPPPPKVKLPEPTSAPREPGRRPGARTLRRTIGTAAAGRGASPPALRDAYLCNGRVGEVYPPHPRRFPSTPRPARPCRPGGRRRVSRGGAPAGNVCGALRGMRGRKIHLSGRLTTEHAPHPGPARETRRNDPCLSPPLGWRPACAAARPTPAPRGLSASPRRFAPAPLRPPPTTPRPKRPSPTPNARVNSPGPARRRCYRRVTLRYSPAASMG